MQQFRRSLLFLAMVLCFIALVSVVPGDAWADADMKSIVNSINAFSFDLYMKCRKPNENLFLSGYSAAVALTMAYAGARGGTESQMAKVLHYAPGRDNVHKALSDLQRTILSAGGGGPNRNVINDLWQTILSAVGRGGPSLNIANALWGQQGYRFEKPFLSLLNRDYGSPLRTVDFKGNPAAAVDKINEWASHETRGRITKIVDPESLSAARLILANAIYFKGKWREPFQKGSTTDDNFYREDGSKARVKMMHQAAEFSYAEVGDFQVLQLPYKGEALSMMLFLPRRYDMLHRFEDSLPPQKLLETMTALRSTKVHVCLPRFKLTESYFLNDDLTALGMTDAFSIKKADFAGICREPPLFIKEVIQQTFVKVDEQGTEAAAVTAVEMLPAAAPPPPIPVFCADHPFMFLILHRPSNCILFMGRITNPAAAQDN